MKTYIKVQGTIVIEELDDGDLRISPDCETPSWVLFVNDNCDAHFMGVDSEGVFQSEVAREQLMKEFEK